MASCDNCTKGYILPGEPVGSIVAEYNGAYLSKGPEGYTKRAIVLLTDWFGLPLVNCKIIADHLAKNLSCDIWVPGLFDGMFLKVLFSYYLASNILHRQASLWSPWKRWSPFSLNALESLLGSPINFAWSPKCFPAHS